MNPVISRHYPLKSVRFLLLLAVAFFSCKKVDIKPGHQSIVERFLKLPASASPQLNRIIWDLKAKEKDHPFIEQFVAQVGYPMWGYAEIKKAKSKGNLLAKEEGEEIVEIPVIQDGKQFVNALLEVKLDMELLYKLLEGDNYASYGFDKDAALNADKVVTKLMAYEKTIWNRQIFKIDDNRLFNYWNPGVGKPSSFFVQLVTNNITNDMIVYVYGDCEEAGTVGTDDGGDSGGDGDDWTYVNGGELTGHVPGQSYTWVEPNSGGSSGTPNAPRPICLNDIIHIEDNSGGGTGGWNSSPILSGGAGGGGGSSGSGEGPCTPFPWVPWGVRPGTYTLFNPCLEEVPPPLDNGNIPDPCSDNSETLGINTTNIFNNANLATAKTEMTANYDDEKSFSFGTQTVNGQIQMAATPVETGTGGESPFVATDPNISITGGMHIHIGGHPEPSVNDILQLANVNANTNHGYTTEFVVNESGEKYAIAIINAGKAESFYNKYKDSYVAPGGWDQDTKIGKEFYDVKIALKVLNHQSENNAHMLAQAYILSKYKSGIALLQQQPDGTFHEIHQQVIKHKNSDTEFNTIICL